MKRILSLILAWVMMFLPTSALAEDDFSAETLTAEISVKLEPVITFDILNAKDIHYTVNVSSLSDRAEGTIIKSSCGDKEYPEEKIVLAPHSAVHKEYIMEDLLRGEQRIKIEVVDGMGKKIADYSTVQKILPPSPEDTFLAPYTRKLGVRIGNYNEAMTYNQILDFDALRAEHLWGTFETVKGVVDVSEMNSWNFDKFKNEQYDITYLIPRNNAIYGPDGFGFHFFDKENYDAYANVVAKAVDSQKEYIDYYEVLNEPNSAGADTTGYAYLSDVTYFAVKDVNPDIKVSIGSVAGGDAAFVERTFNADAWAHCDAVANHPYIRPSRVDEAFFNKVSMMTQVITRFGGWKDHMITELGWPTHTAGVSREQAAIELAKATIVADYFDIPYNSLYTTGDSLSNHDPDNSEHNFGVIVGNGNGIQAKPAIYTLRAVTDETRGAVFAGKIPFENKDIEAYLYLRDGAVTCAIWSKGEECVVDIPCSSAVDMYGNPVSVSGGVRLGETITYLRGISRDWLVSSLEQNIEDYIYTYTGFRNAFQDSVTNKGYDKAVSVLRKSKEYARELANNGGYPSEDTALEYMEKHYALNKELITLRESGEVELSDAQLCGMLYLNQWAGMLYNAIYIMAVEDNTLTEYVPEGRNKINETRAYMDEKKGNGTLSYAEAIMVYANDYTSDAEDIMKTPGDDPMKARTAKAWDKMGRLLAETARDFAEIEPVGYDNVVIQLLKPQRYVKLMKSDTKEVSVYNFRGDVLTGNVQVVAPDGKVVAKSETVSLNPKESVSLPITFNLNTMIDGMYKLAFVENGNTIVERDANLVIEPSFFIEMKTNDRTFENTDNVSFNITYRDEGTFDGKVSVEPLCNWTLNGADKSPVKLESGVVRELTFGVNSKEAVPYHFYPFKITVYDSEGIEVYERTELLSFTAIKKTDKELYTSDFDGDITDWADAYPTFARYPADPEHRSGYPLDPTNKDNWYDRQYYGRMMTKWDDNFLYVLFDVFDWYHENLQDSANIWNGDSIQLSFDTLNDCIDVDMYDDNDFEFGFAYNEKKGNVVFSWKDSVGGKEAEKPSEWVNIIRNQQDGMTRYMVKIPREAVAPLKFTTGNVFGMDALFNNSNTSTRVDILSFADGISHGKQPWKFWDFTFVEDNLTFDNPGDPVIPVTMEPRTDNQNVTDTGNGTTAEGNVFFSDIHGHWAEKYIMRVVDFGGLTGMDDGTYQPDRNMTRAEFVTALAKCSKKSVTSSERVFSDVSPDSWYGNSIYTIRKQGWIPEEMGTVNFYPEQPITRQEAFYMAWKWLADKSSKEAPYKIIAGFNDTGDISEYAVEAFQILYNFEVISGDNNGNLNPDSNITRGEVAKILSSIISIQ